MRLVIAFALDEPWSVVARLIAYGAHAAELGIEVTVKTLTPDGVDRQLDFAAFSPTLDVPVLDLSELVPGSDDVVMFSAPKVHHTVTAQYGRRRPRFIHLLQSGIAASAVGDYGYGYRLFQKPMTRIVVAQSIRDTILRLIGTSCEMALIEASIDLAPFAREPRSEDAFGVVINAFDGGFCGRVLDTARLRGFGERVRVVTAATPVAERAAAYRASTVLLASPAYGEGLCQPALEAMAAGCAVIMTDCEARGTLPDGAEPASVVRQGDVEGMVRALLALRDTPAPKLAAMRGIAQAQAAADAQGNEKARAQAVLAPVFELEGVA